MLRRNEEDGRVCQDSMSRLDVDNRVKQIL